MESLSDSWTLYDWLRQYRWSDPTGRLTHQLNELLETLKGVDRYVFTGLVVDMTNDGRVEVVINNIEHVYILKPLDITNYITSFGQSVQVGSRFTDSRGGPWLGHLIE